MNALADVDVNNNMKDRSDIMMMLLIVLMLLSKKLR